MSKKPESEMDAFVGLLNLLAARGLLEVFDPSNGQSVRAVSARIDGPVIQLVLAERSAERG